VGRATIQTNLKQKNHSTVSIQMLNTIVATRVPGTRYNCTPVVNYQYLYLGRHSTNDTRYENMYHVPDSMVTGTAIGTGTRVPGTICNRVQLYLSNYNCTYVLLLLLLTATPGFIINNNSNTGTWAPGPPGTQVPRYAYAYPGTHMHTQVQLYPAYAYAYRVPGMHMHTSIAERQKLL